MVGPSPEFDVCPGEPGNKASWLVEDWAIKDSWNSCYTTKTSNWTKIHYNSIACIDSVTPPRERACLDLLRIYESIQ